MERQPDMIKTLFATLGLGECTDAMIARYHEINIGFWQRLETDELASFSSISDFSTILISLIPFALQI